MLEKIKRLLRNKEALLDYMNLLAGIVMLAAIFAYGATRSEGSMYLVIFMGGLLNLLGGWKLYAQKTKRNIGMSMMMLGIVVLILCLAIMVY